MITRDPAEFLSVAAGLPDDRDAAYPRAVFLVAPDGFALAEESASDNIYMHVLAAVDPSRALRQHRALQQSLSEDRPAIVFTGDPATPDAVFPNNVHATARVEGRGRMVVGHMRHPTRRREAHRADLREFFTGVLGYSLHDLSAQPGVCELTGSMVVDRARGIALCGLGERCDLAGARAMHAAFGLRAMLVFDLAPTEFHANVVLSILGGRALLVAPDGFADPAVPAALMHLYPTVVELSHGERAAFSANCIALSDQRAWWSERAADALLPANRRAIERAGFGIGTVALDEIEKAGGSLRCCVGEIY